MVQELVLKIQQEIKKQPLTKSDTLAKLGDVVAWRLQEYSARRGHPRTEEGFIASQPKTEQRGVKEQYFHELERLVFFDDDNKLARAVRPGVANAPTTDKVLVDKVIRPLIHRQPLKLDMDEAGGRDAERALILLVLNAVAEKMLPRGWDGVGNAVQKRRAQNFFYQGSIGWWLPILEQTLRFVLMRIGRNEALFIEDVEQKNRDKIINTVEALCDWAVWSTEDPDDLKAMRSNTVKNVKARFYPDYSENRLLQDLGAR
jgi:hypothetical protein